MKSFINRAVSFLCTLVLLTLPAVARQLDNIHEYFNRDHSYQRNCDKDKHHHYFRKGRHHKHHNHSGTQTVTVTATMTTA